MYYSTIHLHGWIVLFCADIRAVNYTDWHDVDENERTIVPQGGAYNTANGAGVTIRHVFDAISRTSEVVASSNMKN